ncbi:hypothetical protein Tco_1489436 [Tanacetum coccineum]
MTSNESVAVHRQPIIAQDERRKWRVLGDNGNIMPAQTGVKKQKVEVNHYDNRGFPQQYFGAFPSDMSLGKPIPIEMSLGNSRWGILVRDTIPSDNPQRRCGSHSFFSQAISATVANFSPATCRWGKIFF